ncbi:MAG: hypothetical protein QHC88_13085 [Achromobacter sp.]|uniref:glycine-rich domain-containing protein n=1 Tax=Achromobacter sp. TaxID=134375 RepID=UPI0029A95932|nr:hypothetical protein [Achromobacter sp.]MDX3986179.1 hypothetical protein [Achromobacter sp.]
MQASNAPTKSAVPFANSGTKNTIPVASQIGITPGLASFTDGFPPLTMTPLAAGGVPPYGADFNGILNFLSAGTRWSQAGGGYVYDAAFSTAIGGYPKGAALVKSDLSGYWLNTTENNTTNPDAGGAGWTDLVPKGGRLINVRTFDSSATYVPTPGVTMIEVQQIAGGGAGGGCSATGVGAASVGLGGSAGAFAHYLIQSGISSTAVTIGAGGTGVSGQPGGNGSATSFGGYCTCAGGAGGGTFGPTAGPAIFLTQSNNATPAIAGATAIVAAAGAFTQSSAFILSATNIYSGQGANTIWGAGGGGQGSGVGSSGNGAGTGGGGSASLASTSARAGGNGAAGKVIIWEYA